MVAVGRSGHEVWKLLENVKDPEIPVLSVVDMRIVKSVDVHGEDVVVTITPTFVGCPALDVISGAIQDELLAKGFRIVTVRKDLTAPWSTDMLSEEAREKLRSFGIAAPSPAGKLEREGPTLCPYCKSPKTHEENSFGSTLCKQIYYCDSCQQSFEKFKSL